MNIRVTAEGHGGVEFLVDDLQGLGDAGFAHGAQAVEEGAAYHGAARAQGPSLEHVLAGADAAVHPHFDLVAHRIHNRRQRGDGGRRAVELAAAVVAHHDGVGAGGHGQARVFGIDNAFEDQLAAPALLHPGNVSPGQARVELAGGPVRERAHVFHALHMADDITELPALGTQHFPAPGRLGGEVENVGQCGFWGGGEAVLQVLVALADHLQIKREHQGFALGGLGAVDQAGNEVAVAHHVELEPERCLGVLGNVLDRADAHGREREGDAEFLGGAGGEYLAVGVLHAGQAGRGDGDGHGHVAAQHLGARAAGFDIDGNALAQANLLEVGLVGAVGAFGPGAGVGVVIEHARHALLRHDAQVFDIGDHWHGVLGQAFYSAFVSGGVRAARNLTAPCRTWHAEPAIAQRSTAGFEAIQFISGNRLIGRRRCRTLRVACAGHPCAGARSGVRLS